MNKSGNQKRSKKKAKEEEPVKLEGVEEGKLEINESNEEGEKAKRIAEESKREAIQMTP